MSDGRVALSKLLYRLYAFRNRRLRELILRIVTRLEGGQMYSKTLRHIYRDYHNIDIGLYSYGGCFDRYRIAAFTRIGRYCSFAKDVYIFNRNHPLGFKSTHPFFFNTALGYVKDELIEKRELVIGNDVWVGQSAMILPAVQRIGDGAVIGAGAVVTRDVPDFAVVAGNPAKIVKCRFSEETIREIKSSGWWYKDIEELKENLQEFLQPVEAEKKNEVWAS